MLTNFHKTKLFKKSSNHQKSGNLQLTWFQKAVLVPHLNQGTPQGLCGGAFTASPNPEPLRGSAGVLSLLPQTRNPSGALRGCFHCYPEPLRGSAGMLNPKHQYYQGNLQLQIEVVEGTERLAECQSQSREVMLGLQKQLLQLTGDL